MKLPQILKIILILTLILLIAFQIKVSVEKNLNEYGKLTFIQDIPEKDIITKKYAYISGGIKNPGVFEIQDSTRLIDLIALSGGFSEEVNPSEVAKSLNLSAFIKDQDKVYVPTLPILGENNPKNVDEPAAELIDINSAAKETLTTLPGVGDSTAQKIIENRPYNSIEDLLNVPGIGPSKLENIKDLITAL